MRWFVGFTLLLLAAPPGILTADTMFPAGWPNLSKAPTAADSAAITHAGWAASRDALAAALAKNYRPGSSDGPGSTGNPTYQSWLLLWKWCDFLEHSETDEAKVFLAAHSLLPRNSSGATATNVPSMASALRSQMPANVPAPKDQPMSELVPPDIAGEWTADGNFLRMFFDTLSPLDYSPQVLRILVGIRQEAPDKFSKYEALAIALAVVYDQKTPAWWPHNQVKPNLVPKKDEPAPDRFAFWVKSNEKGVLETDLRQLPPEQLKFVVDAPLDESELLWAQTNIHLSRNSFGETFGGTVYNYSRLQNKTLTWDKEPYTLANIRHDSGICVDQAYFACIAGKAVGLPTLFFSGQTASSGGHAWFGYLKSSDQWDLNCGRYAGEGLVTGNAYDPQTWMPLSDHELTYLSDSFRKSKPYVASRDDLTVAELFESLGDEKQAAKAFDSAIAVSPRNAEAWAAKTAFLKRTGAKPDILQAHYQAAYQRFSNNNTDTDLKVFYQKALAELANQSGDPNAAKSIQRQIVNENEATRPDLALNVEVDKIAKMIKAGNLKDATHEFEIEVPMLNGKAGGQLFYKITQPLATALYQSGDQADARTVMDYARGMLKPEKNSILDTDMTALAKMINSPLPKKTNAASN